MPNLWIAKADDAASLVAAFISKAIRVPVYRNDAVVGYRYVQA